jgi:hypothetical protein
MICLGKGLESPDLRWESVAGERSGIARRRVASVEHGHAQAQVRNAKRWEREDSRSTGNGADGSALGMASMAMRGEGEETNCRGVGGKMDATAWVR